MDISFLQLPSHINLPGIMLPSDDTIETIKTTCHHLVETS